MKVYEIKTTFSEKVYGRAWYRVEAESKDEALAILRENPDLYLDDLKTDDADWFEADLDDITSIRKIYSNDWEEDK